MLKIDKKYDVILFYASDVNELTGHIFECFDYYLFLRDYYRVGILFISTLSMDKLQTAFESKYIEDFNKVSSDIIYFDRKKLSPNDNIIIFDDHTRVLIADANPEIMVNKKLLLFSKKIFGFMCKDTNDLQAKHWKDITYLQDYRIYGPNKFFKSIDYVKKLPFKWYKKSNKVFDNTGLMYVTFACRKITPQVIKDYHERSGCTKTILAVPEKLPEYEDIDDVIQTLSPIPNFFDTFDTYIYTPVQRKFDCSPRLVTECFLQNKQVMIDLPYVDIGLQTRYNDCKNNLDSLNLKEGDDIVKILS